MAKKKNYLNNRDILREINKSKISYCYFIDKKFSEFDYIVEHVDDITEETINLAKEAKAARISLETYREACDKVSVIGEMKPRQKDFLVTPEEIKTEDVIFRVMTYEHIPEELERKKTHRLKSDKYAKLNFPPFKHYAFIEGELTEVGRSHWKNGLHNGQFSTTHGRQTEKLARMFIMLTDRIGQKGNFRRYSYIDEMKLQALLQLTNMGLLFNESKSDNPFSYYTATVTNSFKSVLNLEKKQQLIRDDLRLEQGLDPSFSRMIDHEMEVAAMRESAEVETASPTIDEFYDNKSTG